MNLSAWIDRVKSLVRPAPAPLSKTIGVGPMKITAALELLLQATQAAARLSALIATARAEGREELTADELHTVIVENDKATADLALAIEKAKAEGR